MTAHLSAIWESIADTIPEQAAVIQGDRTISWRDYEERAAKLAQAFLDAGVTRHAKVGMYLFNSPEYCETNFAALKIGAIPINVNYRYVDEELIYLLDNADVEALVYHRSLSDRVGRIAASLPKIKFFVQVDDGPPPDTAVDVSAVDYANLQSTGVSAERIEPKGDEEYILFTGGTTGMPKGVVYSLEDFTNNFRGMFPQLGGLEADGSIPEMLQFLRQRSENAEHFVVMSGPPLMHGTGCWLGMITPHLDGATVVLDDGSGFDPVSMWGEIERHSVQHLVIVGDAFARPLLRALDEQPQRWDLSALGMMISSGAMFSSEVKSGLIDHIPHLSILDVLGSTEGGMGSTMTTKDSAETATAKFAVSPTAKVFDDSDLEVVPGSGVQGRVANGGLVPLAYYKDPEKSARTFREIDGVRYSFPGDMAIVEADGSLTLLGRGSHCINTGGEKVFPEEVEEILKTHPAVEDSLVFGVDDERFGSRVAAVVSLSPGAAAATDEILAHTREHLAPYKIPRELTIVEQVPRAANGKADYKTARTMLVDVSSG